MFNSEMVFATCSTVPLSVIIIGLVTDLANVREATLVILSSELLSTRTNAGSVVS